MENNSGFFKGMSIVYIDFLRSRVGGTNVFTCKLAAQLSKAAERGEGGGSAELAPQEKEGWGGGRKGEI